MAFKIQTKNLGQTYSSDFLKSKISSGAQTTRTIFKKNVSEKEPFTFQINTIQKMMRSTGDETFVRLPILKEKIVYILQQNWGREEEIIQQLLNLKNQYGLTQQQFILEQKKLEELSVIYFYQKQKHIFDLKIKRLTQNNKLQIRSCDDHKQAIIQTLIQIEQNNHKHQQLQHVKRRYQQEILFLKNRQWQLEEVLSLHTERLRQVSLEEQKQFLLCEKQQNTIKQKQNSFNEKQHQLDIHIQKIQNDLHEKEIQDIEKQFFNQDKKKMAIQKSQKKKRLKNKIKLRQTFLKQIFNCNLLTFHKFFKFFLKQRAQQAQNQYHNLDSILQKIKSQTGLNDIHEIESKFVQQKPKRDIYILSSQNLEIQLQELKIENKRIKNLLGDIIQNDAFKIDIIQDTNLEEKIRKYKKQVVKCEEYKIINLKKKSIIKQFMEQLFKKIFKIESNAGYIQDDIAQNLQQANQFIKFYSEKSYNNKNSNLNISESPQQKNDLNEELALSNISLNSQQYKEKQPFGRKNSLTVGKNTDDNESVITQNEKKSFLKQISIKKVKKKQQKIQNFESSREKCSFLQLVQQFENEEMDYMNDLRNVSKSEKIFLVIYQFQQIQTKKAN